MYDKPKYDTPFEVKPNSGSLRKSEKKIKQESPDYYGSFKLDLRTVEVVGNSVEFKLSGWKSVDKRGQSFLSLKVNTWKPEQDQAPQQSQQSQQSQYPEQDDDIPF
jgi:single-stranded DNA-binding protein